MGWVFMGPEAYRPPNRGESFRPLSPGGPSRDTLSPA